MVKLTQEIRNEIEKGFAFAIFFKLIGNQVFMTFIFLLYGTTE
jgi:hypothetical protein